MLCMKEDLRRQRSMHLDVKSSWELWDRVYPHLHVWCLAQRGVCVRERDRIIVWGPLFISIYSSK